MGRKWIVVGDLTSSSGRVITGSPFTDIEGMAVARVGDKATCPLHKGIFPIITGDGSIVIDGQSVALHGSHLACGCKVLATRQSLVHLDDGTAAGASASQQLPLAPIRFEKPAVCLECLLAGASNSAPFLVRA
ncbi:MULTISPECIES: PAAR domain-containing protein [Stenotrophomonas]|uniref:PAAR domain-containing protein n=1 Tax=Stenotrophomonas TaxID=40323 RepID=UPI0009E89041|nr:MULTISPECIES: PAAR domain-containing protein [Stenotrophomonas]